jgi:uncharacterized protein (TIGR00661 family)
MNIIYGICSWGLGHATRSLPIIRRLLKENHEVKIISHDRSLQLLKKELNDTVSYIDLRDYPLLISENKEKFIAKSIIYWPLFIKRMEEGLIQLKKIVDMYSCDCIISDGRYDMYHKEVPSFFISHQIRILNPLNIKIIERGSETFNEFFFKRFNEIIVPDYKTEDFSGKLSHQLNKIDENKLHYIGILSDFNKKNLKKDIDYFISLSGPEPQRSILEKKIRTQLSEIDGAIVMTLGKTEIDVNHKSTNVKTYSYLSKEKRENLLNRSKMVISRSGYSTILDLAVIGCKALLIPTPGQIEQEYLAEYHNKKNTCYTISQDKMDLKNDIMHVKKTKGFKAKKSVDDAVENVMQIISTT